MYCHERFSQVRETSLITAFYTFLAISSVILGILTVIANTLILHALRKSQTLHAATKALFCSLALSDLGVGIVVCPLFAAFCFAAALNDIEAFCTIRGPYTITGFFLASVSFCTMTVISLDRFYAFTLRLRYHQLVTRKRVLFLLSACWIFGLFWPFSWSFSEDIAESVAAFIIFCCVVTSTVLFIKAAISIRRHQRQIQEQQSTLAPQQHARNQFSINQYKKSLNTTILVFCLLLACYLPFFAVLPLNLVTGSNSNSNLALNITGAVIKLNSLLNPLVYCWRMREIRREVMSALSCLAC